jgi:PAS domain S-box-containing protein
VNTPLCVLLVEDSEDDAVLIARELRRSDYDLTLERVDTPEALSTALAQRSWDIIIADYSMPRFNGMAALKLLQKSGLDLPFILVSGTIGEDIAVGAMKAGAHDYVMKDNLMRLGPAVRRELHEAEVRLARRRAEESLRESEEKFKGIAERSLDVIFISNAKGIITYISPSVQRISGFTPDECIGKRFTLFLPALEIPRAMKRFYSDIKHHQTTEGFQLKIKRKDGGTIYGEINASPIIRDNKVVGTQGVIRDITKRRRAEQLLQTLNMAALAMQRALTHEEIFAAVAEEFRELGISCMLFPMDESQSRLFTKYLSYETKALKTAEEYIGLKHEDFSIPIEAVDVYKKVVWGRKTVFVENANDILWQVLPEHTRGLAGKIAKILKVPKYIPAPIIVEDKVIGVFSVQSDDLTEDDVPAITAFAHQMAAAWRKANLMQDLERSLEELKRTQAQFVQAQKMEAIGRLAGGVAHDFNNILTAVKGYTGLLLNGLASDDPLDWPSGQTMRADLEEIDRVANRAAGLIRQLLAFSRKQILQPRVLNLNAVVTDMGKMLERLIGDDIDLAVSLDPELGRVRADPGQIEQVIMNLAVNARDAMPQGGVLTIETANVELDETYARQHVDAQSGPYVMLAVSDTGIGMDDEVLPYIFDPFFTTKEMGTGLGLSTVHGIAKQSGGHIWVYSEPGQGTTFKIYLPRVEEAKPVDRWQVPDVLPRGTETALLVEDEEMVRDLACRILAGQGYTVLEARHSDEALLLSEKYEGPIHLLVTDVVMPGMRGGELAERLASSRPDMKVLYVSSYTDNAIVNQGMLNPGVAFLQKPFTPANLAYKVREVLDAPK